MKRSTSNDSPQQEEAAKVVSRRHFLKALGAGGGVVAASSLLPGSWLKLAAEQPNLVPAAQSCTIRRGAAIAAVRDASGNGFGFSSSLHQARAMGLDVVYHFLGWDTLEPQPGQYNWLILDDILAQVQAYGLQVVLRLYNPPDWYTSHGSMTAALSAANRNAAIKTRTHTMIRNLMQALTRHVRTSGHRRTVAGYVIWNEPNILEQWDGQPPDPVAYMALLKLAYQGAKAGDPQAKIVSAPLAPTANKAGVAINDLSYLAQLYDLGLINYVDYVGLNGLGFQHSPDHDTGQAAYNFMRLNYLHEVMLAKGDDRHKVWALEVGWLRESEFDMGDFEPFKVTAEQQAQYLARAFEKAASEWCDWLELMVIWNLDFKCYYPPTSAFHWYSLMDNCDLGSSDIYLPLITKSPSGKSGR